MDSPHEHALAVALNLAYPGAYSRLDQLETLPEEVHEKIMEVLVTRACQSQHIGTIDSSRRAIGRVSPALRHTLLPRTIDRSLDFDDEWEFRRAVELLRDIEPSLLAQYRARGLQSPNPDIREAAKEFSLQ